MNKRRPTKPIYVGDVKIGGGADVAVQSMTKTDTRDVAATVRQIHELEEAGCDDHPQRRARTWRRPRPCAEIKKQHQHSRSSPTSTSITGWPWSAPRAAWTACALTPGNLRDEDQVRDGGAGGQGPEHPHPHRRQLRQPSSRWAASGAPGASPATWTWSTSSPRPGTIKEGEYSVVDHMVATALWESQPAGGAGLRRHQDFHEGLRRAHHRGGLPYRLAQHGPLSACTWALPKSGTAQSGSIRTAVGIGRPALRRHRRHHPRVPERETPKDEVHRGLRDSQVPEPAGKRASVLVACPSCGRADVDVIKLSNEVDALLKTQRQARESRGDGLRGQRPRRGQGRRRGHRRRRRPGHHLPQGRKGPRRPRETRCSPRLMEEVEQDAGGSA